MGSARITNLLDTHVGQDQPLTNYNLGGSMYIRQWAGSIRVGYLYFTRPFPLGATLVEAKLHLYGYAKTAAGSIQLYLRRLFQTINFGKVTWDTRATSFITGEVYSSRSDLYPDRTEFVFDITNFMQEVSDGTKWYGLQLGSDWTSTAWSPRFMSSNHPNPDLRPWVEFVWSDRPDTPTQLSPSSGHVVSTPTPVLRCNYTDVSGDTELDQVQFQVNTADSWTSPAFDSGLVPAVSPQFDLTGSAFTAVVGTTYFWRCRVRDGAGLLSGWSAAASFVYRPLPTVTIDAPALPPNNYVEEPTPPMTWTVTSGDQESYSIDLYRKVDNRWSAVYHRGRTISDTTDGFGVPAGVITEPDDTYLFDLRVWDGYDREAVPNGQVYRLVSRQFTYQPSAETTPVTDLTATAADPYPGITLHWQRATMPDSYAIIRDGRIIASGLDPDDDTHEGGTSYAWKDRFPIKGRVHTYEVQAIVNNKAAADSPTVLAVNRIAGTWLVDADTDLTEGGAAICIVDDKVRTFEFEEDSATYGPLGARQVSLVTQSLRAYKGNVSGQLVDQPAGTSSSAVIWRNRLMAVKGQPGMKLYLFITDMTVPVVVNNIQCSPGTRPLRHYLVSFDWYQQGLYPFTPRGLG